MRPFAVAVMKQGAGNYRWAICALLFFATTVNYLDRQVLRLLAPALSKEFGWSNSDYANFTAVFQFDYAISTLFAVRFIDAIGTKCAYVIAVAVWSLGGPDACLRRAGGQRVGGARHRTVVVGRGLHGVADNAAMVSMSDVVMAHQTAYRGP